MVTPSFTAGETREHWYRSKGFFKAVSSQPAARTGVTSGSDSQKGPPHSVTPDANCCRRRRAQDGLVIRFLEREVRGEGDVQTSRRIPVPNSRPGTGQGRVCPWLHLDRIARGHRHHRHFVSAASTCAISRQGQSPIRRVLEQPEAGAVGLDYVCRRQQRLAGSEQPAKLLF